MQIGKKIFLGIIIIIHIVSNPVFSWGKNKGTSQKINILVSVFPLKEFAGAVFKEKAEVKMLIPPGAEVHTWNPKPSDLISFNRADLFVYIGANMEPWLGNMIKYSENQDTIMLEARKGLPLIKSCQNTYDPHIWLDFEYDQKIIDKLVNTACLILPEDKEYFEKNGSEYKEKLRELDTLYQETLSSCRTNTFILGGHSAFGYLAKRYNLQQISVYGLSPDSSPTPKLMTEIIKTAKKLNIEVVYYEQFASGKTAKILADEIGARTMTLNPGANLSEKQIQSNLTFIDIMKKNLENLKHGLKCK